MKVCPSLYKEDPEDTTTCKEVESTPDTCSFYQGGKCVSSCGEHYLAPANQSNSQCQLICSNGEYFSDGLCVLECDDLEYMGDHGNCHGCLDEDYDNGYCL